MWRHFLRLVSVTRIALYALTGLKLTILSASSSTADTFGCTKFGVTADFHPDFSTHDIEECFTKVINERRNKGVKKMRVRIVNYGESKICGKRQDGAINQKDVLVKVEYCSLDGEIALPDEWMHKNEVELYEKKDKGFKEYKTKGMSLKDAFEYREVVSGEDGKPTEYEYITVVSVYFFRVCFLSTSLCP